MNDASIKIRDLWDGWSAIESTLRVQAKLIHTKAKDEFQTECVKVDARDQALKFLKDIWSVKIIYFIWMHCGQTAAQPYPTIALNEHLKRPPLIQNQHSVTVT